MPSIGNIVGRLWRVRSGNVAIMTAIGATVLIGAAAFAVDEGKMFIDRRTAQSITDLAALAAAVSPANAPLIAGGTVSRNGVALAAPLKVTVGRYVPDASLAVGARFVPAAAASANAVRVDLATSTQTIFGRIFRGADTLQINTTATAVSTAMASFAIGSRLLSLEGGILNQLLSQTLGGNVSLKAMDYRSLADLDINLFTYLDKLATRADLTALTYESVLDAEVGIGDAVAALHDSADGTSAVGRLLGRLAAATNAAGKLRLGNALSLGDYAKLSVASHPHEAVMVSALDLLNAAARLAGGDHQLALALDLGVPALANAYLELTVGEPARNSGWVAVGTTGAKVRTAQTRLALRVKVAPLGLPVQVDLPIYIEVAYGQATLTAMNCGSAATPRSATLAVSPGVVNAWIADMPGPNWADMGATPTPVAATLLNAPLIKIKGRAHADMGNMQPKSVQFSATDIERRTVKTVKTGDFLTSLTASLVSDLQLEANVIGLPLGVPGQLTALRTTLSAVTVPLDKALATILSFLGVGLGEADVWMNGLRCDRAVLVH